MAGSDTRDLPSNDRPTQLHNDHNPADPADADDHDDQPGLIPVEVEDHSQNHQHYNYNHYNHYNHYNSYPHYPHYNNQSHHPHLLHPNHAQSWHPDHATGGYHGFDYNQNYNNYSNQHPPVHHGHVPPYPLGQEKLQQGHEEEHDGQQKDQEQNKLQTQGSIHGSPQHQLHHPYQPPLHPPHPTYDPYGYPHPPPLTNPPSPHQLHPSLLANPPSPHHPHPAPPFSPHSPGYSPQNSPRNKRNPSPSPSPSHTQTPSSEPKTPGYILDTPVQEASWYPREQAEEDVLHLIHAVGSSGSITSEGPLTEIFSRRSHPFELQSLREAYKRKYSSLKAPELTDLFGLSLASGSRTPDYSSNGFRNLLRALVLGPVELDTYLLFRAMAGAGTNEEYLQIVLLGRTNLEIKAITAQYEATGKKRARLSGRSTSAGDVESLRGAVEGDVRGNLKKLYLGILTAARKWDSQPPEQGEIDRDILDLHGALTGTLNVETVLKYFTYAPLTRLRAVSVHWKRVTGDDSSLEQRIEKQFHGDVEDALLYLLLSATDEALRDASLLHQSLTKSGFNLGKSGSWLPRMTKQEEIAFIVAKVVWRDHALTSYGNTRTGSSVYAPGDYLKEVEEKYAMIVDGSSSVSSSRSSSLSRIRSRSRSPAAVPLKLRRGDLLRKIKKETSGEFENFLVQLWVVREKAEVVGHRVSARASREQAR